MRFAPLAGASGWTRTVVSKTSGSAPDAGQVACTGTSASAPGEITPSRFSSLSQVVSLGKVRV